MYVIGREGRKLKMDEWIKGSELDFLIPIVSMGARRNVCVQGYFSIFFLLSYSFEVLSCFS